MHPMLQIINWLVLAVVWGSRCGVAQRNGFFWSIVVVYVLSLWLGDSKDYLHEAVRTVLFLVSLAAAMILDEQDAISLSQGNSPNSKTVLKARQARDEKV
jgi:hypothetical protein